MTSPTGQPVNAVFGFTRDLLNILRDKKPTYLLCAFDLSGPTFRDEIYTEYKAHRSEMPDELVPQFDPLREMVTALGVPILEVEGYEADDILATVARIADEEGARCSIVTSDKDCRQLISSQVRLYNVRKNQFLDAEVLHKEWGIRPDQVVDFQALVGDSVDNVPGVPLIGPKIAGQLLQQYDTLDQVLVHAGEVAGAKRRENLQTYKDQALLSRELVRLDRRVPLEIDWHAARAGQIDARRALELCSQFGFHRIAEDIRAMAPPPPPAPWPHTYHLVNTPEKFASFLQQLRQQPRFAFSAEAAGASPRSGELVGCAFAWQPGEAWYVAVHALEGEARLEREPTLAALKPILEDPAIGKLGHNLKQDRIVLRRAGIELAGVEFD
jgi:DNA polymerase-1